MDPELVRARTDFKPSIETKSVPGKKTNEMNKKQVFQKVQNYLKKIEKSAKNKPKLASIEEDVSKRDSQNSMDNDQYFSEN